MAKQDGTGPYKKRKIDPVGIRRGISAADLIDGYYLAYNSARLKEAAQLLVKKVLEPDVTVGVSLSGALTPAGLGAGVLIPLIEAGFIDYIVSTGANLYHDIHFGIGYDLFESTPFVDDVDLRKRKLIRIYDIVFDQDVLLDSDAYVRRVCRQPEFQKTMGTTELHWLLGKYVDATEKALGMKRRSLLAACYRADVPIFTPAPGDGTIGMNIAAAELTGSALKLDMTRDICESAAYVYDAKASGGKSAVLILGGGTPKNYMLQTEPFIQEILYVNEKGHDYFIQITDARADTGGLSGATPNEAVTWGKVDPEQLPDSIVCYTDSTIAAPLLAAYMLSRHKPRALKRLYRRREAVVGALVKAGARQKKRILGVEQRMAGHVTGKGRGGNRGR
ncbi:MAG: deoxyhypusine synthase [Candidatus Brocadiae bacterium]|nr:deoxyhypusine synthase [Candidatus Brocadiia bacterium]